MSEAKIGEFEKDLLEWNDLIAKKMRKEHFPGPRGGREYWLLLLAKAAKKYDILWLVNRTAAEREKREALDMDIQNFVRRKIDVLDPNNLKDVYTGAVSPYYLILSDYEMIRRGELDCSYKAFRRNGFLNNAIDEMKRYHPLYILHEEKAGTSSNLSQDVLNMYEAAFYGDSRWDRIESLLDGTDGRKLQRATKIYIEIYYDVFFSRSILIASDSYCSEYVTKMHEIYESVNGKPYNV